MASPAPRRTSTPNFKYGDSGFFECNTKSHFKSQYHTLSPVSENSPNKREHEYFLNFTPFSKQFTPKESYSEIKQFPPNIIRKLNYEDSGFISESANESEFNDKVFSLSPWFSLYDISNEENLEIKRFNSLNTISPNLKVDFLKSLKQVNCLKIISDLLSYMTAEDLCQMKCVSKIWQEIILKDVKANKRGREYLKIMRSQRENRLKARSSPFDINKRYERSPVIPRLILNDISNNVFDSKFVPTKSYNTRFDSFIKEGKNLSNGTLKKCPKCSYAAKAHSENNYVCTYCEYTFCGKCFSPLLNIHSCPMLQVPILIIGSKQCKKNLKRL